MAQSISEKKGILFWFALFFLVTGLLVFYLLPAALTLRALGLAAGCLLAIMLFFLSIPGKKFIVFFKQACREGQKVVWPSRKETWQAALTVFIFAFIVAVFLWLVDKIFEWAIFSLILGWT